MPGLVGDVHPAVAWRGNRWAEPSLAFRSALTSVGWTVRRNAACLRAQLWPAVAAEDAYLGEVELQPVDAGRGVHRGPQRR